MCIGSYADISIHTPTKGATATFDFIEGRRTFQSTLPRRERPISAIFEMSFDSFQSTLPREERLILIILFLQFTFISIHAPARGATATCIIPYGAKDISIHAPARGATGKTLCYLIYQIFQSTLPREERPISPRMFPNAFYFNPRSRERSDVVGDQKHGTNIISIHAPARGATVWT